jgi:hypothetical protein
MFSPHSPRGDAWPPYHGLTGIEGSMYAHPPMAAQSPGQIPPGCLEPCDPGAPALVGREREMAVLQGALAQAMAGHGQLVLITSRTWKI